MEPIRLTHTFYIRSLVGVLIAGLILSSADLHAQIWKKVLPGSEDNSGSNQVNPLPVEEEQLQAWIKEDCKQLASSKMKGRVMGSQEIQQAGMYIGKTMNQFGVAPYARNFVHTFWYVTGKDFTPETRFVIGRNYIFIPEEAFPAPYSATGEVQNYILPDSREMEQPWIVPLYESAQQANNPDFDWINATYKRAVKAEKRGAAAVIFYDAYGSKYMPKYTRVSSLPELSIPVIIVQHKAYEEKIKNIRVLTNLYLNIKFKNEYAKAANIVGIIDNGAEKNVVICAHYDGPVPTSEKTAGMAADDNASGVAAMMSLGHLLIKSEAKKYNYLLVALSGGASGQLGSEALLKDKTFDTQNIAYVINLDRIGRIDGNRNIFVSGVTSSTAWIPFFRKKRAGLQYQFDSDDIQPSDQVPFLKKNIPALSFSTSVEEVNPQQDNFQHLNMSGIKRVVTLAYQLVLSMNDLGHSPVFAKAKRKDEILKLLEPRTAVATRPSSRSQPAVSGTPSSRSPRTVRGNTSGNIAAVGIVCDTAYDGFGVRILDISKQHPAERAGLQAGDIIMQIGSKKINNLADYTTALGDLKPGKKLSVRVKRGVTVQDFTLVNL